MNGLKSVVVLLALLLAVGTAEARGGGRRAAEQEAETGGWQVAYGNEMTEQDVERGEVLPGVSIFAARGTSEMMQLHDWANALILQATDAAGIRRLDQNEQFQAMRFTVRTIREFVRSRSFGSQQTDMSSVEFKAGLLEYRNHSRNRDDWEGGHKRRDTVYLPYVGMRTKTGNSSWDNGVSRPDQGPYNPSTQVPQQRPDADEVLNALSLTNTARKIDNRRWEWTAYIDGPALYLGRIASVTYILHPTFNPNRQQGNRTLPGHPLTATGWGVFELRAEVTLDDGNQRSYRHMLQF